MKGGLKQEILNIEDSLRDIGQLVTSSINASLDSQKNNRLDVLTIFTRSSIIIPVIVYLRRW